MDSKKASISPNALRNSFENLCKNNSWDDPSEEFFNDFCAFISHFDFQIIGIGSESEIGIQSLKARIRLDDDMQCRCNNEEKQGAINANKNEK